MPYCTTQDLIDRFGEQELIQLTDRNGDGAIDSNVLDQAIADADEQIDRKLRGRYTVPISPVPAELVPIACDIVRYLLYLHNPPEEVTRRYESALKELRDYAAGVNILDTASTNNASAQSPGVSVVAPGEVFSQETLSRMP